MPSAPAPNDQYYSLTQIQLLQQMAADESLKGQPDERAEHIGSGSKLRPRVSGVQRLPVTLAVTPEGHCYHHVNCPTLASRAKLGQKPPKPLCSCKFCEHMVEELLFWKIAKPLTSDHSILVGRRRDLNIPSAGAATSSGTAMSAKGQADHPTMWLLDTGASFHMRSTA